MSKPASESSAAGELAPEPARPARRMAPERRREQLIETALQLCQHKPPEQLTIDDLTRAADVSRALFYRYFPNLDALHFAALGTVVDELIDRLDVPTTGPLLEQLHAALEAFFDVAQQHRLAFIALMRSGSAIATGETDALVDQVRHHIVAQLLRRSGLTEPSPLMLATLRGWVALVEGTSVSWLQEPTIPRPRLLAWLAAELPAMATVTAEHEAALS